MGLQAVDIAGFVLGVITFLLGLGLKQLVANHLPPARLKQIRKALAEARSHAQLLAQNGHLPQSKAADVLKRIRE